MRKLTNRPNVIRDRGEQLLQHWCAERGDKCHVIPDEVLKEQKVAQSYLRIYLKQTQKEEEKALGVNRIFERPPAD